MLARIRRLWLITLILLIAVLLTTFDDAHAMLDSRPVLRHADFMRARVLSLDMRPLQEFSFVQNAVVVLCRMNPITLGDGFACEFQFPTKTLLVTSIEMDRIDAKLATYAPGDRIFLRGPRLQLECSVARSRELDWVCRY